MQIGVLGPLEVRNGSGTLEISGARLRLLLTVLALEAPRAVSAHALVAALWGEEPPADQTNALQSLVSRLRKALGNSDLVQQSAAGYRLAIDEGAVDLHRFEALVREAKDARRNGDPRRAATTFTAALALWRGEPTDAIESGHAPALLARLDEQHLDARAERIEARLGLGEAVDVIAELEGLVAAHPLRERYAALLVTALSDAGRQGEALASYERARATLADELGADPSADLKDAHLRALAADPAPRTPPTAPRTNLRAALTSFVGRDEQLAQISKLLGEGRLVTLVGPGGAGKTRLATEAAGSLVTDCAVWLAELAPVTDPADVPQTVLGALGLRDAVLIERSATMTARDATSRLIDALTDREAVIVVDNCEHVIDAAAHLADQLLTRCPGLRVLATSREPLGIFGESLVVVPPLGQPAEGTSADDAMSHPAIQLFADRAHDVAPAFAIDDTTVTPVVEIVRRLDGQPLAIELAAARLRTLPVEEIARRLSDRFRLLTGGSRTAMPRHRTLRAVVEWSWDLLSEPERLLAERLAVFTGGLTAAAAAAVCGGPELPPEDIDDLLASLVDKSLLQTAAPGNGEPRYRMLETIREFGLERMAEREEVGTIRRAHADFYAALVAEADTHLRRREQIEWMALLGVERDNVLAAVKFFGDNGEAQQAVNLVGGLGWYWMTTGSHGEIVTWVTFALESGGEVKATDRLGAEAFVAMNAMGWEANSDPDGVDGTMKELRRVSEEIAAIDGDDVPQILVLIAPIIAMFAGNEDQVGLLVERALTSDDPWIAAAVRTFRAAMAENSGDTTTMREDAETALAAFRTIGERWGMANSLQLLGQVELMEGNLHAAAAAYREGLELAEAIGSREDIAVMRLRLADILTRLGDTEGAIEQAEFAALASRQSGSAIEMLLTHVMQLELARFTGDVDYATALRHEATERVRRLPALHPVHQHGLAILQTSAAKLDLDAGDLDAARAVLAEAYTCAIETKDMPIVANAGVTVALVAAALGQAEVAAEMLGAAAQLRGADDFTQLDIAALVTELGVRGDGPNSAAYARGAALSRADAIARVSPATL